MRRRAALCCLGAVTFLPSRAGALASSRGREELPGWLANLFQGHKKEEELVTKQRAAAAEWAKLQLEDTTDEAPASGGGALEGPGTKVQLEALSSKKEVVANEDLGTKALATEGELAIKQRAAEWAKLQLEDATDEAPARGEDVLEGLEWIDPEDPSHSLNVTSSAQLATLMRREKPIRVPYTVWSFGEMPAAARASFCEAAINWETHGAFVWHMPAVEPLLDLHPGWKSVWAKMPRTVMKSDVARYLVAYEKGGTYADYDVRGRSPPPVKEGTSLVLQVEQTLERWQVSPRSATGREKHYLQRIAQYYFSVEPKHPFFEKVLAESLKRVSGLLEEGHTDWSDKWVLWSTGPDIITTVYHDEFENDPSVVLVPQDTIGKHLSAGAWKRGKDTPAINLYSTEGLQGGGGGGDFSLDAAEGVDLYP